MIKMNIEGIDFHWLGHDSFLIQAKGKNIYIDPYKLTKKDLPEADIIITTHDHFDHCNPEAIEQICGEKTILVGPKVTIDKLNDISKKKKVIELNPYDEKEIDGIKISAIPAYNTHRFRDPETKTPFHPKESGHIGPIIDVDGVKIYHAGDTDKIPEMEDLKPHIALIPVSGTYVMDVPEAVEAAKVISAKITIPMHVGRGIGELSYREEFKEKLENMEVILLDLEES
ncbi:MAG: MBL fold metallo-hydrolase [Candidatus Heimdallarchaeum aukensis]|uniref:MBL fold metallo-hydrolase n=1 Tax=Candidatus Heimdallarchaeum aukensis TaxID=2876573 RepID=A0A9Y1FLJ5_9ARCH|nr:MAG: MBL fold metallo-hydrolase [Candidatus Heimdallarchaeum aukensis]